MQRRGWIALLAIGVISSMCGPVWSQEVSAGQKPPASQPSPAKAVGPRMELSSTLYDFEEIWQGQPAKGEFTVKNVGAAPLVIRLQSHCGCTVLTRPKSPLAPGESSEFTISYDTVKRRGPARQSVTVTTNDPTQSRLNIQIRGTVKPLFKAIPPANGIFFHNLHTGQRANRTIRFQSKYPGPLNFRLKEGQDFGPFEIVLKEIKPGAEYDLSATTKPPMAEQVSHIEVVLETGLDISPEVRIPVHAYVRPDAYCHPSLLRASRQSIVPMTRPVVVTWRATRPLKIVEVRPSHESIKCEILPPGPPRGHGESKWVTQQIRVTMPPGVELPPGHAEVEILTDSSDPRFQRFLVRIQVVESVRGSRARPPARVTSRPSKQPEGPRKP